MSTLSSANGENVDENMLRPLSEKLYLRSLFLQQALQISAKCFISDGEAWMRTNSRSHCLKQKPSSK